MELWGSGKIEGTPYGSYAKMMDGTHSHGENGVAIILFSFSLLLPSHCCIITFVL